MIKTQGKKKDKDKVGFFDDDGRCFAKVKPPRQKDVSLGDWAEKKHPELYKRAEAVNFV